MTERLTHTHTHTHTHMGRKESDVTERLIHTHTQCDAKFWIGGQ